MSVAFEHPSIRDALAQAGVKVSSMIVIGVPSVPNVFIAWSERGMLLLNPEYAWLSMDVPFLRLPQSTDVLRRVIDSSSRSDPTSKEWEVLCTPLGQWLWAVEALEKTLNRSKKESLGRISGLERFASKHWPGWYEKPLSEIRDSIKVDTSTSKLLLSLSMNAVTVAVLEAISPLLVWSERGLKGNRIGALEDALCYVSQEIADVNLIAERASDDTWWKEMENDLSATEINLDRVRLGGGDFHFVLGDKISALRRNIAEIRKLEDYLPSLSYDEVHSLHVVVISLQKTLLDLEALQGRARDLFWGAPGVRLEVS